MADNHASAISGAIETRPRKVVIAVDCHLSLQSWIERDCHRAVDEKGGAIV
ncbi:MAG: hypothetical protein ACKVS5_14075 [Parvularculaceae bacterium]